MLELSSPLDFVAERYLVMDFDGVFNTDMPTGTFPSSFYNATKKTYYPNEKYDKRKSRFERGPKNFRIDFSPELVSDFNSLSTRSGTLVVWLTTWREQMEDLFLPMGFSSHLPMTYLKWGTGESQDPHHLKLEAMNGFVSTLKGTDKKVVWADDYAFDDSCSQGNMSSVMGYPLLKKVTPSPKYGLSRDEFKVMRKFLYATGEAEEGY